MPIYLERTWYIIGKQNFELETFLTMKYDKNGHDPN